MNDDGSSNKNSSSPKKISSLKKEWTLFWHSILGDDETGEQNKPGLNFSKLEQLNSEQIKALKKVLSDDRKVLHQKIEHINEELEESHSKMENLKLVGGDTTEVQERIEALHDLGESLAESLSKLDEKLKWARSKEA